MRIRRIKRIKRDRRYYVYSLCYPDGTPFYVGKGKGNRARKHNGYSYNTLKQNVIKKIQRSGFEVLITILFDKMPETHAFRKEAELILHYGRRDTGTGILCNLTDGGEGISGFKRSAEHNRKLGQRIKKLWADKDSVFRTKAHRDKMSAGAKAAWEDPAMRKKISESNIAMWKDPEGRRKRTEAIKNAYTEEMREAQSLLSKKIWDEMRPELLEKMRKAAQKRRGIPFSADHKRKMSESQKTLYLEGKTVLPTWTKLNSKLVLEIRLSHSSGEKTIKMLAAKYSLGFDAIYNCVVGKSWTRCADSMHLVPLCKNKIKKGNFKIK